MASNKRCKMTPVLQIRFILEFGDAPHAAE
jgi:hypothetical protein